MENLKNEVIQNIRSCLISTKGQVSLKQLEDDYRTLLGDSIPFHQLGYKNLESFLRSVPSLTVFQSPSGQVFVDAKISEKSAHISSLIAKQKSSTKRKPVRIAAPNRYNRKYTQPPPETTRWRPKRTGGGDAPATHRRESSRLATVHNQFVSGYSKPKVPSKIVVPERSAFAQQTTAPRKSPPPPPPKEEKREAESAKENGLTNGVDKDGCPVLNSTMKRISRLMSKCNLDERDSGNSSPTTEYGTKFESFDFTKTGDVMADLKNFAALHKLGDIEVKITENKVKKSNVVQYHCRIRVGGHNYLSYPEDFFTREAAELHAAQKALDSLIKKFGRRKSLLISSNDDIIQRVPPMLEKHQGAVWMWQIEADYIDRYNEQLPSDWLQVIDSSLYVSIEKCLGGYVLKHCNPDDVLQKGKKLDISLNVDDVSVPCNTVQFNVNNRLYAFVTVAHSSNEIWCQHYGTPEYDKFTEMAEKMDIFYKTNKHQLKPKQITFGSCFVIFHEDNWFRMRALSMPEDGCVDCFLIDYGMELRVSVEHVYVLKRQFAVVPAQAFVCRLDGLEELYEVSVDSDHLHGLVHKEFVLEMIVDESGENTDLSIPVVMYEESTGASINEQLISLLTIDAAMPVLDRNAVTEVYVSNIESNGDVYVQVRTPGYFALMEHLDRLEKTISKEQPARPLAPITRENSQGRTYLVKCKSTNRWLRATICDWSPYGALAQIYFVDRGNTAVVDVGAEAMYPLDKLDDVVSKYPHQAIKVRIMIDQLPKDFVDRASKLMPHDQTILLKIVSYDNEKVAWVEFFKRSSDGGLFCINKSIVVEAELQNIDDESNNNEKDSRKRLINWCQFHDTLNKVPSGGLLRKPDLPKKGDYFNVNVPFAVNPWNFFVQPLDTLDQLTKMMAVMQEFYSHQDFSPLPVENITPGRIYASKHEDGSWYRTNVLKVIHSGSISVFYCDFGYYTNLTVAQLVPLDPKFMNLPYQALKAKIAGIKPIKNKWTVEDCDMFKKLVAKKQFVSVLVNVEKDELYKSDFVLQLLLIDTSSDEDVNIKEILIEKGIATSV